MNRLIHALLVEDNPGDALLTQETLHESKVRVDLAIVKDGEQAMDYLHRRPPHDSAPRPDLILLDLNLPRKNGREVLAEVKQTEALRSIPVVVLTSSDAETEVVKSYALGAACYVTKPVGLPEFQAIVRAIDAFWFSVVKLP